MTPFTVRQKQESRGSLVVSLIRYIEIELPNHTFRLLKRTSTSFGYLVDGKAATGSYRDSLAEISFVGNLLQFTTKFGLRITWDGNHRIDVSLCSSYSRHVCGLCGNADGNAPNDFVDRDNKPVNVSVGDHNTKFFSWGRGWGTFDDAPDAEA